MNAEQMIGWTSSVVLACTIGYQVWRQWSEGESEGVSPLLFVGQLVASTGFLVYAALTGDPVFVVTNALLVVVAILGLLILWRHRRRATARSDPPADARTGRSRASARTRSTWAA